MPMSSKTRRLLRIGREPKHPFYKKIRPGKPLNIELISALYGVPGNAKKQKDVSKIIQQHLDARDYDFTISNTVAGGDPAPGVVKTLVIKYKLDGKLIEKKVPENGQMPFLY